MIRGDLVWKGECVPAPTFVPHRAVELRRGFRLAVRQPPNRHLSYATPPPRLTPNTTAPHRIARHYSLGTATRSSAKYSLVDPHSFVELYSDTGLGT